MIDFDDWLQKWMTADAQEAADLLRLALAEADEDSRGLLVIAQAIVAAYRQPGCPRRRCFKIDSGVGNL